MKVWKKRQRKTEREFDILRFLADKEKPQNASQISRTLRAKHKYRSDVERSTRRTLKELKQEGSIIVAETKTKHQRGYKGRSYYYDLTDYGLAKLFVEHRDRPDDISIWVEKYAVGKQPRTVNVLCEIFKEWPQCLGKELDKKETTHRQAVMIERLLDICVRIILPYNGQVSSEYLRDTFFSPLLPVRNRVNDEWLKIVRTVPHFKELTDKAVGSETYARKRDLETLSESLELINCSKKEMSQNLKLAAKFLEIVVGESGASPTLNIKEAIQSGQMQPFVRPPDVEQFIRDLQELRKKAQNDNRCIIGRACQQGKRESRGRKQVDNDNSERDKGKL